MTAPRNPRVTAADEEWAEEVASAANIVTNGGYYEIDIDAVTLVIARHREAAEAASKAREAALVEAGDLMRDRLLAFVSALALETDCGPDVDAITAWDALLGRESRGRLGFARAALTKEPDA